MQKPKTKSKDPQANILTQVLAQFDIETQVNKMVIKSFQTLMRSNKQAFDFIKDSERKFIEFQQRVSKAENYYKNIQLNVNAKIQVTSNLSKRLEQFSVQYWNSMKEHTNQIIGINKKNDEFNQQLRKQQQKIELNEKQISRFNTLTDIMKDKLNRQIQQLTQYQNQKYDELKQEMRNDRSKVQTFIQNLHQSKALLQSKSSLLTQLLHDIALYKQERPMYQNQIKQLYDEIGQRSTRVQTGQLRVYVDNKNLQEKERVDQIILRIDTRIKLQQRDRIRADDSIKETIATLNQNMNIQHEVIKKQMKDNFDELNQNLINSEERLKIQLQTANKNSQQILKKVQDLQKLIPPIQTQLKNHSDSLQLLQANQKSQQAQLNQATSNIGSLNQLISTVVKQSETRKEELNKMKMSSQSQSSLSEQIVIMTQKINLNDQGLKQLKIKVEQNQQQINQKTDKNHQMMVEKSQLISLKCNSIQKKVAQANSKLTTSIQNFDKRHTQSRQQIKQFLIQKIDNLDLKQTNYTDQAINNIKSKLQSLKQIHQEIKQFKQTFKNQIQENNKVNQSIQQKMQRLMGLFTKLKSDSAVKFQAISADQQRRNTQIKNSLKEVDDLKNYVSIVNQILSILLGVLIWSEQVQSADILKQSNIKEPIKISSILEGWVLEIDEKDRTKYRGESMPKKKLLQMTFEFLVSYGDKIKGSTLQNGKDVFHKIIQSRQQIFQQHKRATSKRRQSQLPKLHM